MSRITDFEDLLAWQRARELAKIIFLVTNAPAFSGNSSLRKQLRRASISVTSNIAEGFGRGGNREFINFLSMARGSLAEAKTQLYLAKDFNYLTESDFHQVMELVESTGRLVGGLIRYLKNSEMSGSKFKTTQEIEEK